MLKSEMGVIPGIGTKSIERLYGRFKSMEGIEKASMDELSAEIGRKRALVIRDYFKKRNN
jgi:excinuclease ABC subunit C